MNRKKRLSREEIDKLIWDQAEDPQSLKDPRKWLGRANNFHDVAKLVIDVHIASMRKVEAKQLNDQKMLFSTIIPFLYLLATAVELYLKGYLIAKRKPVDEVTGYKHDLKKLRLECLSYGDDRFNKGLISYITDSYGRVFLENGGLRYPNRKPPPLILPDYVNVMILLKTILTEEIEI